MNKINGRNAAPIIRRREEFTSHGALSAKWTGSLYPGMGELPLVWRDVLREATKANAGDPQGLYIVYSYDTPIAWYSPTDDVWTRPVAKYSMTTSHHQGRCPAHGSKGN